MSDLRGNLAISKLLALKNFGQFLRFTYSWMTCATFSVRKVRIGGMDGVLVADFLLQHSLDANNAVPSKATDRQWGREPRIKNLSSVLISEGKVLHSCLA